MIEVDQKKIQHMLSQTEDGTLKKLRETLAYIGIHYFHFTEIFQNGFRYSITTHPLWIEHFYTFELHKQSLFYQSIDNKLACQIAWPDIFEPDEIITARSDFEVGSAGGTVIERNIHSCLLYHFASKPGQQYDVLFHSHPEIFKQFINFFHDRYEQHIEYVRKTGLIVPFNTRDSTEATKLEEGIKRFITTATPKRYFLRNHNCYLTYREKTIAEALLTGISAVDIGKNNFISHRTVEKHIQNIKFKVKCKKMSVLIKILSKDPLFYQQGIL